MEFEVWLWFFSVIERELGEARFKHFLSKYRGRKSVRGLELSSSLELSEATG